MEIYNKIRIPETKSKLSYLVDTYGRELDEGHGEHIGLISDRVAQKELDKMTDAQKMALIYSKDIYFYDMFRQYDTMYRYLADRKLIKIKNIPYPEMPLEFLRLLLKTTLGKHHKYKENKIHQMYDLMGESLYLYYQGLLYEYYCDVKNKEVKDRLTVSVQELLKELDAGNRVCLYDSEAIDAEISFRFQEALERVSLSDGYAKRMEHLLKIQEGD